MPPIVGRERELSLVRRFLEDVGERAGALHLHGEAGIGKSTLWSAAIADADGMGFRVVTTRPTQAEGRLPFAGLNDLFGDLVDEVALDMPAPQRAALDVAFLRSAAEDSIPEPLAISLAVLTLLRGAAERKPLILAIDDAPWLDESTASVLEFALRRLEHERIGVLVAERTVGGKIEAHIVSAMPAERVNELRVAPLTKAATERLLASVLDLELPPSTAARVHRTSGGNPFYAVEIGRALQRRGDLRLEGDLLPVPDSLSELLRDRLDELSAVASDVVEIASALSRPTRQLLSALMGTSETDAGLQEAVAARVVQLEGDAIRFTHPLLAAELYAGLGDTRRRELHRRLAGLVSEPEERARHVALAADGPDEAVAAELEVAAERAYARGAPDAAADFAEQALSLTPVPEVRARRLQVVARYHVPAGDLTRAGERLEEALAMAPAGEARAEILLRLAEVRLLTGDWLAAEHLLDEALTLAGGSPHLEIEIRLQLGGVAHITTRRWTAGAKHVTEAMRIAEALGDPAMLARTIGPYATWRYLTGAGIPAGIENRAAELEPWTSHLRAMDHPTFDFAGLRWREGDVAGFRELEQALLDRAERNGDYSSIPFLLGNLVRADLAEGRPDVAVDRLERAERLARATGQATGLAHVLLYRTLMLARLGRPDEAWEVGRGCLDLIARTGWNVGEPGVRIELALLELSRRDAARALEVLEPFGTLPTMRGSPWVVWHGAVYAEALIGVGRLDEARALLQEWTRHAPMRRSATQMRHVVRARALLEAAAGNVDAAAELLASAQAAFDASGNRWGLARTALLAGEIHRRARRRSIARAALEQAERLFGELGSVLWAAHARDQLQRIGAGRDEVGGLTPTQHQVAELAVDGLTNRQIGDRLFMSVHTVEAHLSAVYRALEIGGRRELGPALEGRAGAVGAAEALPKQD